MRRGSFYFTMDEACMQSEVYPPVDLLLTEEFVYLLADVPGIPRESLEVRVNKGYVEIRGSRCEPQAFGKATHFYKLESFYGRFERRVTLPVDVEADKVSVNLSDGVLEVRIPRLRPRVVEIPVE